jgi:Hsp70 protein
VRENKRGLLKLTRECESAMKALSMSQQAEPYVEAMLEGCDYKARVTRMRFEDMCYDLYDRAKVRVLIVISTSSTNRTTVRVTARTTVSTAVLLIVRMCCTSALVVLTTAISIILLLLLAAVVITKISMTAACSTAAATATRNTVAIVSTLAYRSS